MSALDALLDADTRPTSDEVLVALTRFMHDLAVKFGSEEHPVTFEPMTSLSMRRLLMLMTIRAHGDDDIAAFLTEYGLANRIALRGHSYSANDADRLEQHTDAMVAASKRIQQGFRHLIDRISQ
jgi:hypothetical protein